MTKVLLACGAGASSGFIAQQMRKAAKKKKLDFSISAVSDTVIMDNIDGVSVLLLGPHLAHKLDEVKRQVEPTGTKVALIDKNHYATLDGEGVLNKVIDLLEDE